MCVGLLLFEASSGLLMPTSDLHHQPYEKTVSAFAAV
jgi:hypothetical protein